MDPSIISHRQGRQTSSQFDQLAVQIQYRSRFTVFTRHVDNPVVIGDGQPWRARRKTGVGSIVLVIRIAAALDYAKILLPPVRLLRPSLADL